MFMIFKWGSKNHGFSGIFIRFILIIMCLIFQICAQKICYKTYLLTIHYILLIFFLKYLHKQKKLIKFAFETQSEYTFCQFRVLKRVLNFDYARILEKILYTIKIIY